MGLRDSFLKPLFKAKEAEYFRFAGYNEYLITRVSFRLLFVSLSDFVCEVAIGNPTGHFFEGKIKELENSGVKVISKNLSREEFDRIARFHPILKNDPWVKQRLTALDTGVARKYS